MLNICALLTKIAKKIIDINQILVRKEKSALNLLIKKLVALYKNCMKNIWKIYNA